MITEKIELSIFSLVYPNQPTNTENEYAFPNERCVRRLDHGKQYRQEISQPKL
jgi:hypothetical protein